MSENKSDSNDNSQSPQFTYQHQNDYFNTTDDWELTWPIWHMLSRDERKAIAIRHGMKTIGEFEEYMSLHKAEEVSSTLNVNSATTAYSNELAYGVDNSTAAIIEDLEENDEELKDDDEMEEDQKVLITKLSSVVTISDDDDLDNEDMTTNDSKPKAKQMHKEDNINLPYKDEEVKKYGGILLTVIPEEILHKILTFLEVDYYNYLSQLNPIWNSFLFHHNTNKHNTYQILCTRIYLQQSKRKALHVSNFQNSYKNMYFTRPRVKTGCGLYIFKYAEVKRIERDMWTEVPVGAILELIYYRYLYFLEGGVVLYALTCAPPMEVIPKLRYIRSVGLTKHTVVKRKKHHHQNDPNGDINDIHNKYNIVWGKYEVTKYNVDVYIEHPWCHVLLQLSILRGMQVGMDGVQGRFRVLKLEQHLTSLSGEWRDGNDAVQLCTPTGYFRFLTDWSL